MNRNREAVGDAQNLTQMHDVLISQSRRAQLHELKSDVLRHLHMKFSDAVGDEGTSMDPATCAPRTDIDWVKLGRAVAVLFKATPLSGFGRGAFSTAEFTANQNKKKRKRSSRKQEDPRLRKSIQEQREEDEEKDATKLLTISARR